MGRRPKEKSSTEPERILDPSILEKIDRLESRAYPSGHSTFAIVSATPSEREIVDRLFFGKTWNIVDIEHISETENPIFLIPEAVIYFWKPILKTLYLFPNKTFSLYFTGLYCKHWYDKLSDMYFVQKALNTPERKLFLEILKELSTIITDDFSGDEIRKFLAQESPKTTTNP